MPRIDPVDPERATPEQRAAHDTTVRDHGRMTNLKSTLLHSMPAFHALMEWYTLRDAVQPWLGERAVILFSHAISSETECLICSTFFRRILIDWGENPDELMLDGREQLVVDFGRALSTPFARVPKELYGQLAAVFSDEQVVALTAFGAMMVATNVFNNALEVPLDEYLETYRATNQQTDKPTNQAAPGLR